LTKAIPKIANAAGSPELRQALLEHLEETKLHSERLDQILSGLNGGASRSECKGMKGLIYESAEVMNSGGDPSVVDAALIATVQRMEHYEMAGYGCARTFAQLLGLGDAANLLQESLTEEGAAAKKLTKLAMKSVNVEAAQV
jgi:ferritin-like metal-binding protein YciE